MADSVVPFYNHMAYFPCYHLYGIRHTHARTHTLLTCTLCTISRSYVSLCTSQATATVQVTVQDVNDNAPVFPQDSYNATVLENSRGGVFVVSFNAAENFLAAALSLLTCNLDWLCSTTSYTMSSVDDLLLVDTTDHKDKALGDNSNISAFILFLVCYSAFKNQCLWM